MSAHTHCIPPFQKYPGETMESMAEIGQAFMDALPKDYSWCQSPSEVIADLQNERDETRRQIAEIRLALLYAREELSKAGWYTAAAICDAAIAKAKGEA